MRPKLIISWNKIIIQTTTIVQELRQYTCTHAISEFNAYV